MSDMTSCKKMCWIIAAVAGVVLWLILAMATAWSWIACLLLGVVLAVILAILLPGVICDDEAPVIAAPPVAEALPEPEPVASPTESPAPEMPVEADTEQEIADPDPEPEVDPEPESTPEPEPAVSEIAADGPPQGMDKARDGGPDDLKKIKGIGPKLEEMLHVHGIYHFDQIAGWGPSDVAWMDDNLKGFKGRVTRDDWVGQAETLAAGGATKFSRKVDDGDVY